MSRQLLIDIADIHCGHIKGLLNPKTILCDEDEEGNSIPYSPRLTATEIYLWNQHQENALTTIELAHGDDIIIFQDGDPIQGQRFMTELVSTSLANQIIIAIEALDPLLELPNVTMMRLATGTSAHEYGEGSATQLITNALKSRHPEMDIRAINHGLLTIDGFKIDYTHHGPYTGSKEWLKGNVARSYLLDLMMHEDRRRCIPPDLVLRAHYHNYVCEILRRYGHTSTLVISPPMCGMGEYGRQATRSQHEWMSGWIVFEIVDGKLHEIHELIKTVDLRTKEIYNG